MSKQFVPKRVFFTCGAGQSSDELTSFELALREASIERFNLVTVSSILPPNCRIISRREGTRALASGSVVFTVLSRISSNEAHRRISASIGVAIPEDPERHWGYFSEYHSFGDSEQQTAAYSEKIAHNMFCSITDAKPVKTTNITKSAVVSDEKEWTTVLAAAVFLMDEED